MGIKGLIRACERMLSDKRFEEVSTEPVRKSWRTLVRNAASELAALQLEIKLLKERKSAQLSFKGEIIDPKLAEKVRDLEHEVTTVPEGTKVIAINVLDTNMDPVEREGFRDFIKAVCDRHKMDVGILVISGRTPLRAFSEEDLNKVGLERTADSW